MKHGRILPLGGAAPGHTMGEVINMLSETQLLNHIYQTAEMGQDGIRTVLKYTQEPRLVNALNSQLEEYQRLQNSAGAMLHARGEPPKGIGAVARLSSEAMTAVKSLTDPSASNIAEMMIQGSTMGVSKSLRTLRDCQLKDPKVKELANKLLRAEQDNIEEMKQFL